LKKRFAVSAAAICFASFAQAQVKLEGTFVASKECEAVVSMKKGTNPDNAVIAAGKSYRLLGKNNDNASHYWIEVPEADPKQRWVELSCGTTNADQAVKSNNQDGAVAIGTPAIAAPVGVAVNADKGTVKPKPKSRAISYDDQVVLRRRM